MAENVKNQVLKVKVFNVGQGDHILLELPNGEFGIIDSYYDKDFGWSEMPSLSYLKSLKKSDITISFICISHPDYDHTKGLNSFFKWVLDKSIIIRNIWMFSGESLSEVIEDYAETLEALQHSLNTKTQIDSITNRAAKITKELTELYHFTKNNRKIVKYIENISQLNLIEDITFVSLGPLSRHVKEFNSKVRKKAYEFLLRGDSKKFADKNLLSSILLVIWGNHKLLFGGDTNKKIWFECLEEYIQTQNQALFGEIKSNFIKASHHGSKNSSSVILWKKILHRNQDNFIAISAGRNKKYKHPSFETIKHINMATSKINANTKIFSTNTCNNCIKNQGLPIVRLNWLKTEQKAIKEQTKIANVANRGKNLGTKLPSLSGFLGYEFQFDLLSDSLIVSQMIASGSNQSYSCIYPNLQNCSFPNCAI